MSQKVSPKVIAEFFGKLSLDLDALKCPKCGKGRGEKGLEVRFKLGDVFCHTCRKPWPLKLQVTIAPEEFSQTDA